MPPRNAYVGDAGVTGGTPVEPSVFPPGSYTFTPSTAGVWKFAVWGAGGGSAGATGGTSAGYAEISKRISRAQSVSITVGAAVIGNTGGTTTLTFPDASTVTCTGGSNDGVTVGVATGGDVNINGSIAGAAGGGTGGGASGTGAGAPANLPYRGGRGTTTNPGAGQAPGGGGLGTAAPTTVAGGSGLVLAVFLRS